MFSMLEGRRPSMLQKTNKKKVLQGFPRERNFSFVLRRLSFTRHPTVQHHFVIIHLISFYFSDNSLSHNLSFFKRARIILMSFPYTHSKNASLLDAGTEWKRTKKRRRFLCNFLFFGWMKNECKFKETTATFVNQKQKCCFRRQQQQWHQPEWNLLSCSPPFRN